MHGNRHSQHPMHMSLAPAILCHVVCTGTVSYDNQSFYTGWVCSLQSVGSELCCVTVDSGYNSSQDLGSRYQGYMPVLQAPCMYILPIIAYYCLLLPIIAYYCLLYCVFVCEELLIYVLSDASSPPPVYSPHSSPLPSTTPSPPPFPPLPPSSSTYERPQAQRRRSRTRLARVTVPFTTLE